MEIEIVNIEPQKSLSIKDTCTARELSNKFNELFGEISQFMQKHSIEFRGMPFAIYHSFTPEKVDLEAGIPIKGDAEPEGRINVIMRYGGKAAKAVYFGPYEGLEGAWNEFMKWPQDNNYKVSGDPFEIYTTDPTTESDSSKWQTDLYFPLS